MTLPVSPGAGPASAAARRWLCDPRRDIGPSALDFAPLGTVLEAAIDAKLVCLLGGRRDAGLSRPMRSVLGQLVRANTLHNRLHRGKAIRIVRALAGRAAPVAVLNGLAYDTVLYPPGGLRQFTDIDLLVGAADLDAALDVLAELGFTEPGRGAHTRQRSSYSRRDRAARLAAQLPIDDHEGRGAELAIHHAHRHHDIDPAAVRSTSHRCCGQPAEPRPHAEANLGDSANHTARQTPNGPM